MADNKIKINTSKLATDIRDIQGCITEMERLINEIIANGDLLDCMWDGQSSEVFKRAFRDDVDAMKVIIHNLKKICEFEGVAKENYERCEETVIDLVEGIRI